MARALACSSCRRLHLKRKRNEENLWYGYNGFKRCLPLKSVLNCIGGKGATLSYAKPVNYMDTTFTTQQSYYAESLLMYVPRTVLAFFWF